MYRIGTFRERKRIAETKKYLVDTAFRNQDAKPFYKEPQHARKVVSRHMEILTAVIHQCLHQGNYKLAYEAWSLLVRTPLFKLEYLWELYYDIIMAQQKYNEAIAYLERLMSITQSTPAQQNRPHNRQFVWHVHSSRSNSR